MRIALDCMSGDEFALTRNLQGAVEAARLDGFEMVLVGDEEAIRHELSRYDCGKTQFTIVHASEIVTMDDSPSSALRKKQKSSIWVALEQMKNKRVDAVVTAGNTGAAMAMAMVQVGLLSSVERPAIAAPLPTPRGLVILVDAGANVDCKAKHLYQFAVMGSIYARNVCGRSSPTVGLLNVGHEDSKGNEVSKEAYKLLKSSSLNFVGNIEGRDIFTGNIDVILCDGFVGNIVLKSIESLAEMLESLLRAELKGSWRGKLAYPLIKPVYRSFKKKLSHSDYGGAPLLGINGVCIISHGSSSAKAMKNALLRARDFVTHNLNADIERALKETRI